MKPYYEDDLVTLYHGDCREWMPEADVIVTDPPYGIDWNTEGKSRQRGATFDFPRVTGDTEPFDPAFLLALGLPSVLFGANHYADRLPPSPSWFVWDKRVSMGSNDQADCEMAWTNLGGPARVYRQVWNGGAGTTENRVGRHRVHPTQKPVELMRWVVLRTAGTVLDPFMGSGSTLVAAKSLGRRAIGIEIEERYCEIAAHRCSQEVLGLAV